MEAEDYLKVVIEPILSYPDQLKIERHDDERGVLIDVIVSKDDSGRIIGQKGKTAEALRSLVRLLGVKNDKRYALRINPR